MPVVVPAPDRSAVAAPVDDRPDHAEEADDHEADHADRARVGGDLLPDLGCGLGDGEQECEHDRSVVGGQPSAMSLVSVSSG